ncbi:MAG: hypothetical protein LRY73_11045 [Bacillus sp. (in: Bacteria)]|nr:hypothetical protein [Bacillus sp. (in: firmicutes)]
MLKRKDYMTLVDSFMAHEDQINKIINTLEDLKTTVEITHIENINSDEILLRSIRQTQND